MAQYGYSQLLDDPSLFASILAEGRIIMSICDKTGNWSRPYSLEHNVVMFDIQRDERENIMDIDFTPFVGRVHGLIMQPPCTEFAKSGARWWKKKAEEAPHLLENAVALVKRCLAIKDMLAPRWAVMENPTGRLPKLIEEKWTFTFQPHEYAGYCLDEEKAQDERYTKRTCIWCWGTARQPEKRDLGNLHGSKLAVIGQCKERANMRSVTPTGWARAWKLANP